MWYIILWVQRSLSYYTAVCNSSRDVSIYTIFLLSLIFTKWTAPTTKSTHLADPLFFVYTNRSDLCAWFCSVYLQKYLFHFMVTKKKNNSNLYCHKWFIYANSSRFHNSLYITWSYWFCFSLSDCCVHLWCNSVHHYFLLPPQRRLALLFSFLSIFTYFSFIFFHIFFHISRWYFDAHATS